ncbi:DUF4349 domain-containing protein [Paenibacillus athensensis]|nr:DUF4349 domain-containing protein [Paenibacillus athensensis]MCD1261606.1 DUF4349 domain-containing protein [Paenibacillus athensensis]
MGDKEKKIRLQRRRATLTALVALMLLTAGCGARSSDSAAESKAAAPVADHMTDSAAFSAKQSDSVAYTAVDDQYARNEALVKASADGTAAAAAQQQPSTSGSVMAATGAEAADGFNRKLIYKANLVMPVADYDKAQTELRDLVALSGAYILQFSESVESKARSGNYTIKVAANGFVPLLDGLAKISPALKRNVNGQDVTEEYVDLESRLKAKQAVEARLLSFMDKATKTDDLLAFSNELARVQQEIEQLKGRMRYLDQNVAYSTVELRLYEQIGSKPLLSDPNETSLGERIERAWHSSLNVLTVVLQGLLVVLAAALPVLALAAVVCVPLFVVRKRRRSRMLETRRERQEQNAALVESAETGAMQANQPDLAAKSEQSEEN